MVIAEPFKRGLFYSNTVIKKGHPEVMQPLVVDVPKFHLFVDPASIPPDLRNGVTLAIARILNLTKEEGEKMGDQLTKKSRNRKLRAYLSQEERNKVNRWWEGCYKKHKLPRNAIYFVQDYKRSYPFGHL